MPNPFRPQPQRLFDPHRFERLRDFLSENKFDWETYLSQLLIGLAPKPFIFGPTLYIDRADVSLFRHRLEIESLRRVAELADRTEILVQEPV